MLRPEGKKFVACTWRDPHGTGKTQCYEMHELPHSSVGVTTYGWLVRQDERGVSIIGEVISDGTVRDYTFVPTELIEEVKEIKVPKANGHRKGKASALPTPLPASQSVLCDAPSTIPPPTVQSRDEKLV